MVPWVIYLFVSLDSRPMRNIEMEYLLIPFGNLSLEGYNGTIYLYSNRYKIIKLLKNHDSERMSSI